MSNLSRLNLISLLLILLIIFSSFFSVKSQTPKAKKINVGGFRLYAIISGKGNPAVIFESGMGEDSSTWKDVAPAIAKLTQTVVYDRAGLGQSDPSPNSRDANQMAVELHTMLHKAGIRAPYILVGHSLGSWVVTIFAHRYPKETAGLILIDPAYQEPRLRAAITEKEWAEREKAILKYTPPMTKYQQAEKDDLELSGEEALKAFPVPSVPTILLTGTLVSPGFPSSEMERKIKMQVHEEWIAKAPWTKHIFVSESRHYIQNEAPSKVISAIEEVLEKVRQKKA